MTHVRLAITLLGLAVVVLAAAGCGGKGAAVPTVSIGAADYSFTLPDSIAGGLVRVSMTK